MASPPAVQNISVDSYTEDQAENFQRLARTLNSYISDANSIFTGNVGLVSNLGGQAISFTVQVPDNNQSASIAAGWTATNGPTYSVSADGIVRLYGAATNAGAALAANVVTGLPLPDTARSFVVDSNGAFGVVQVTAAGAMTLIIGAVGAGNYLAWGNVSYPAYRLQPYIPSCWPKRIKCTMPNGQAGLVLSGLITDITPGSPPMRFVPGQPSWSNSGGYISINCIPGLLPNRTYSVNLIGLPRID